MYIVVAVFDKFLYILRLCSISFDCSIDFFNICSLCMLFSLLCSNESINCLFSSKFPSKCINSSSNFFSTSLNSNLILSCSSSNMFFCFSSSGCSISIVKPSKMLSKPERVTVKLTTLIDANTLFDISIDESLVAKYNLNFSCMSIIFSPKRITLVGPRLNFSPRNNGTKNDSILSTSVINKFFPKRIASSIFVNNLLSCNDAISTAFDVFLIFCINH